MQQQQTLVFDMALFRTEFNLLKKLGEGHDAKVYLVKHVKSGKEMALKCLENPVHQLNLYVFHSRDVVDRLQHPHIGQFIGRSVDYSCMLLEYLPNNTYYKLLSKGPLPLGVAKRVFHQLCSALLYLHQRSICHGDIKPENIMISNEYQVKLCDFGFARFIDKNQPQKAVGGSKGFTAPEIYQPTVKDLTKCDVFSLGVVFFIMVTGYPPFQTNNPYEEDVWWSMIQDQRFQQYWENWSKQIPIPEGFTDVIEYMLHPDDTKRLAIAELLQHPWLHQDVASDSDAQLEFQKRVAK